MNFIQLIFLTQNTRFQVMNLIPNAGNRYRCRPLEIDAFPKIKVPHTFQVSFFRIL